VGKSPAGASNSLRDKKIIQEEATNKSPETEPWAGETVNDPIESDFSMGAPLYDTFSWAARPTGRK
jgi:hypothetical protein